MFDPTPQPTDAPELSAMHRAMRAAEEAAEKRRLAKLAAQGEAPSSEFERPEADGWDELLVATRADMEDLPLWEADDAPAAPGTYVIDDGGDVSALIAQVAASVPELDNVEVDGDLTIFKGLGEAEPWYQAAAEAALPQALRDVAGPLDVKTLLQALLVEIGDVKRTNAMLMEAMSRLEEKVERTNRHLRERKPL